MVAWERSVSIKIRYYHGRARCITYRQRTSFISQPLDVSFFGGIPPELVHLVVEQRGDGQDLAAKKKILPVVVLELQFLFRHGVVLD